jgi:hypothetical protein
MWTLCPPNENRERTAILRFLNVRKESLTIKQS